MSKRNRLESTQPELALHPLESTARFVPPEDRVYSGMFGNGEVVGLLKNADGFAYGHRIRFENGMEAELLIVDVPVRH